MHVELCGAPAGARSALRTHAVLASILGCAALWGQPVRQDVDPASEPFLKVTGVEYQPAGGAGGKQLIRLKMDLAKEVPTGTKVLMELQYTALTMDQKVFEVKDAKRAGVTFDWVPDQRLSPELYELKISIPTRFPDAFPGVVQKPEVLRQLEIERDRFPPDLQPWSFYFMDEKDKVRVGTDAEIAALEERICTLYDQLIADLIRNKKALDQAAEEIKAGKKFVSGAVLDRDAFAAFLKDWQKKQAATQQRILELPATEPAILQRSLAAHRSLIELGRILSKYGVQSQQAIEKQYGIARIRIERDRENKDDDILRYFDDVWRQSTGVDMLNSYLDRIYAAACPPEPAAEEEKKEGEGEGAAAAGKPESKPTAGAGEPKTPRAPGRGAAAPKTSG